MIRFYYLINIIRTLPIWIILKILGQKPLICEDMSGFRYIVDKENKTNGFILFNRIASRKKLFHNIIHFRIKSKNKLLALVSAIFLPLKADFEISQGIIGGGITVFHGHGTTIVCEKAGKNLNVYQGVTIGKNQKKGYSRVAPIIGDNVTIYTNAVVAGGITIGNNVDIGAGSVVMKDIPDNTVVIGNPCILKSKNKCGERNG